MISTSFPEENLVLDPPPGVANEEIECLPVCAARMIDGTPVIISCWKVTMEELKEIQRTGRVWLMVMGPVMAPVVVSGKNPFLDRIERGEKA